MSKPKITVKRYGVFNHLRYEVRSDGKTLFTVQKKKEAHAIAELIRALMVAKERMNNSLEELEVNDWFVDEAQFDNHADDVDVVSRALSKAGVEIKIERL